jgi:hypothetical protein
MSLIIPANTLASGGYAVDNSLRFNRGSSDSLTRTPGSAGNRRTFTFSCWFKLGNIASSQSGYYQIFGGLAGAANDGLWISDSDKLYIYFDAGEKRITNQVIRDISAWYHVVFAVDTTQATASNRIKLYLNGSEITSFSTSADPSLNYDSGVNNTTLQNIGTRITDDYFDGYMAETVLIDGSQLDPTSFGEFDEDSGIWKPIDVSGLTFGTNGFYLDFEDSAALGDDVSGNGNDFTVNNLTAIDQTTDTPTNNFATMNPLAYRLDAGVSLPTYSEGNTVVSYADDSGAGKSTMATIGFQNGKWYWEYKVGTANDTIFGGITRMDYDPNDNFAGRSCYYNKTGAFSVGTGTGGTGNGSYGDSYTTNDIIGVAFDCDNGVIWFSKNGTWQNSATQAEIEAGTTTNSATTGITLNQFWSPFFEGANGGMSANFGSPAYAISSGNTDGNGYGNFEYAVPSGYLSLCTKNLAEYG